MAGGLGGDDVIVALVVTSHRGFPPHTSPLPFQLPVCAPLPHRTRAACLIWSHPVMAAPWLLLLLVTLVPQACAVTSEPGR